MRVDQKAQNYYCSPKPACHRESWMRRMNSLDLTHANCVVDWGSSLVEAFAPVSVLLSVFRV